MTNILVIDEDKICRNNVKYQLCDKGYYVTSLEYLDEARDSEHKYDLVLMENCESLNQYYIEELKKYFNCSVIIMSKALCADDIIKCMKSGADDFILC